jgi:glycosyltransferase involved in cell wall biosynthesis
MSESNRSGVSVVLVARNEETRLAAWFKKVAWADEIIVVDSGSTDRTAEIARNYTNNVFSVTNKLNFDINKNFGFGQATQEWILSLDADEYLTDELIQEIRSVTRDTTSPYDGFRMPRRTFVMGRETHIVEPIMRLFRQGKASFPGQTVHQELQIQGYVGDLNGEILHYTDDSLFERVQKSNMYSECIAAYWYEQRRPFRFRDMVLQPVFLLMKYFLRRGIREGISGFVIAVNGAYSVFLQHAKLWSAYQLGRFPSPRDDFPPNQRTP